MSISSEIERIKTNIANAYTELEGKGATLPTERNSANLSSVVITVPTGGGDGSEYFTETIISGNTTGAGLLKSIKSIPIIPINGTSGSYMFFNCVGLETIPLLDTSKLTAMTNMFQGCSKLKTIPLLNTSSNKSLGNTFNGCTSLETVPLIDTSKVTTFYYAFYNCSKLKTIPQFNTSNVTNMGSAFYSCTSLESVPLIDTNKVTDMASMFYGCVKLKTIPEFNTSNVTNMSNMLYSCTSLETVPLLDMGKVVYTTNFCKLSSNIINLGGFKDLGKAYVRATTNYVSYALSLSGINNLTHDSLMNVINNLYDLNLSYNVAGGGTLYTQQLIIGATNIAKLTSDEIAIATNKGWTVS